MLASQRALFQIAEKLITYLFGLCKDSLCKFWKDLVHKIMVASLL